MLEVCGRYGSIQSMSVGMMDMTQMPGMIQGVFFNLSLARCVMIMVIRADLSVHWMF